MKYRSFAIIAFLLCACKTPQQLASASPAGQLIIDGKLWSSLYQQRAAEYKALCLQAFNIARLRLDEALLQAPAPGLARPKAIITDIDETFLDNSPYAARQALKGKDYDQATWYEWTSKGEADSLTGALEFFSYAASRNIEIFYVTNRDEQEKAGTLTNLRRFRFPFADDQHLMLKATSSGKEDRRIKVAATHDIILLLGDNLSDFSSVFDKKTEMERDQQVQLLADEFGKRFIVLPNFSYGGWEDAVYENKRDWTPLQKDSLIKAKLK